MAERSGLEVPVPTISVKAHKTANGAISNVRSAANRNSLISFKPRGELASGYGAQKAIGKDAFVIQPDAVIFGRSLDLGRGLEAVSRLRSIVSTLMSSIRLSEGGDSRMKVQRVLSP